MKLATRLAIVAVLGVSNAAFGSDWYVDAVSGSDANDGASPATAWKTLTHAIASVPNPTAGHAIHLAAGVYDAQNGEQYPLHVRNHMQILGAGRDVTVLSATAGSLLVYESSLTPPFGDPIAADTLARGLTMRDASVGVEIKSTWNPVAPSFEDLRLTALSTAAVTVTASSSIGGHSASANFTSVDVDGCGAGFVLSGTATLDGIALAGLTATDVAIAGCASDGVRMTTTASDVQAFAHVSAVLERCRLSGNGTSGVRIQGLLSSHARCQLSARSTLFASNGDCGVLTTGGAPPTGMPLVDLHECTLADNASAGLRTHGHLARVGGSVFFGNGDDLDVRGVLEAQTSSSGDADLLGFPGCIQADPLFVAPALGDFRLRFVSPCVETGDPAAAGALDLLGHLRPFDGDLDTRKAPDMGAFELETLHRIGTPTLGQPFGFEFWGASGARSTLLLAKSGLTAPQATPFGDLYLDPGLLVVLGTVPAGPGRPFVLRRTVPSNPALVGQTFSFQALTGSAIAPAGKAYTNPTTFVVRP